ncbi:MAG: 50S ribosomal protein L13 [Pirellulaceae bacterium]|nr:50S ribosomal protein L13 [Pirellulaceae bacterium]
MAGTKTYVAKPGEIAEKWLVVDATDKTLGRLASDVAMVLMGKHRPTYTPHVLTGDTVIIVNAEKVHLSGKKWQKKEYTWFTGYTGLRSENAERRHERHPDRIVRDAVRRMLPKNKLAFRMLERLKVYVGPDHPHQAQQPEKKELGTK